MKSLNEDLKTGQFKQIYLLYGPEGYLKKQYKERFVKAMVPEGDTMNYSYYEGKKTDVKEVIDLAETLPFFSECRLIVFEDTGFFKTGGNDLADYINGGMPQTTHFIFIENEVDKRSKLYKAVKAKGHIVELAAQDENTLRKWVSGLIRKEKKEMSQSDIAYFLNKVGTDMENITRELEKLLCYCIEREVITREDVDAICVTQITNHIFDMVNAVAAKDQRKALDLYYDLLALKEPPMRILFLLARQFNLIWQVKELEKEGYDQSRIAKRTGLQPFVVRNYSAYGRRYREEELQKIVKECVDTEEKVKTGRIGDTLSVELLLIKFSS